MAVQQTRIHKLNDAPEHPERSYVLYWAQMNRRVDGNHGLLYACEIANRLGLPVVFYEGLTCTYQWANDRLHTFVLQGVPETAKRLGKTGIGYAFYLRPKKTSPNHALYDLAKNAAALVTDDYPVFIAADHNRSVPAKLDVAYYAVDSSCVVPMRLIEKRQFGAYTIRPRIHKLLPTYLQEPDKLQVTKRWVGAPPSFHVKVTDENIPELVTTCEIDHSVKPSLAYEGGRLAAERLLTNFLERNLKRYAKERNQPAAHATSHMSPYLHFGQMSSLEIALATNEYAGKHKLIADEFLEELIVRRELAFNYARFVERPDRLENLPNWCQETMRLHEFDRKEYTYTPEQIEFAQTGDALWNATQKEMLLRGKIHGYYRMYWGKRILEWTPKYQDAVDIMVDIHGKYALDGRDPNTFTNILWCFGLHDRAWAERPIYGKLRYLSSDGMKRKTNTTAYIEEITQLERTGKDPAKQV